MIAVGVPATGFVNPAVAWGLVVLGAMGLSWFWWPALQDRVVGIGLYGNRAALDKAHPIHRQIQQAITIDGIWLSGRAIFQSNVERSVVAKKVRRVILPSNKNETLRPLARLTGESDESLEEDLFWTTRYCRENEIEVRWLEEFPAFTVLLANIDGANGWVHIESLLPHTEANQRPVLRVTRKRHGKVVEIWRAIFSRLWSDAKPPPEALF